MSAKQVALAAVLTTSICVAVDFGVRTGWIPNDGMEHTLSRAAIDISVYAASTQIAMVVTNATTGDPITVPPERLTYALQIERGNFL